MDLAGDVEAEGTLAREAENEESRSFNDTPTFINIAVARRYSQFMAPNDDAKRANTFITIAQLKFKQSLRKEEPEAGLPPIPVDTSSQLFSAVDAVLAQNTPVNIQVSECNTTISRWL